MSFQAQPTTAGTYRVKVHGSNKDRYWKYIPDTERWIQLNAVDKSNKPSSIQFKVNIPLPPTYDSPLISCFSGTLLQSLETRTLSPSSPHMTQTLASSFLLTTKRSIGLMVLRKGK